MDLLHGLVAKSLKDEIDKYREGGKNFGEPLPPALLAQAIKFLKDNGIEGVAKNTNPLGALASSLPEFDDDAEAALAGDTPH